MSHVLWQLLQFMLRQLCTASSVWSDATHPVWAHLFGSWTPSMEVEEEEKEEKNIQTWKQSIWTIWRTPNRIPSYKSITSQLERTYIEILRNQVNRSVDWKQYCTVKITWGWVCKTTEPGARIRRKKRKRSIWTGTRYSEDCGSINI